MRAKQGDPSKVGTGPRFVDRMRQAAERVAPPGGWARSVRTLEELKMTLVERVAEWPKQWLQEGIEQGVKQGIEQGVERGLAHERALLCRQAALRFGAEVAGGVSQAVERITDPNGLAAAGDWIVRADTGEELVARLTELVEGGDTP